VCVCVCVCVCVSQRTGIYGPSPTTNKPQLARENLLALGRHGSTRTSRFFMPAMRTLGQPPSNVFSQWVSPRRYNPPPPLSLLLSHPHARELNLPLWRVVLWPLALLFRPKLRTRCEGCVAARQFTEARLCAAPETSGRPWRRDVGCWGHLTPQLPPGKSPFRHDAYAGC
jgi:hypothetical protein